MQLDEAHIVNPVDLNGQVPSLVITQSEGFNNSVAIRGIGFNVPQNDAAQPSVSYHIDGIYIANPVALNTGFLDVDHVEVLRGPQGTVFGQNSVGGTINVITKQPTFDDYTGFTDLSLGEYALVRYRAALNVPVSDTFAIRGAVDYDRHDGFVEATKVPGGYGLSNDNSVHSRLSLLWKPTDDFTAILRAEYGDADNTEVAFKNILDPEPDPWKQTSDWPGRFLYRQEVYSATLTYDLPWASLKSLTSWQSVNQTGSVNEDGEDLALAVSQSPNFYHDIEYFFHKSLSLTQEVDLSSLPENDSNFDWIVGAFYLRVKEKVGYDQYSITREDPFIANLLNSPAIPDFFGANYIPNLYFQSSSLLTRESWSIYGQGTYHITDSVRFTGGARYTHDANSATVSDYFEPASFHESSANAITGRAEIDWDVTPENMMYASFSTGFKPGGGNIASSPLTTPFQFKPETITAYEVGSKNSFMDNKIRLNVAGFYYDYNDLQFEAEDLATYQGGVDNVPSAEVYGVEGEASFLLPYNLRLDTNLTIEESKITKHFLALDNVAGNDAVALAAANGVFLNYIFPPYTKQNIAAFRKYRGPAYRDVYGNSVPMLPEVSASATLTHTLDFSDGSQLLSRVQVQYRDSYINAIFNSSPIYTTPSYVLWDLYFDYSFANPNWDASISIDNLFNKDAIVSKFTNQFGGETTQAYAPPRQFIVKVGYRF
jgi:iron complex outermembrane receptor protein